MLELTDEFFDRAEIRQGEKIIRRGWQTRINADGRKARKLKAG